MAEDDFARVQEAIAGVAGWLSAEEGEALFELARSCSGRGVIVEIGSFKGKSTICLAMGSRLGSGAPVYAIDTHWGPRFEEFNANIEAAGVADLVRPVVGRSQERADDFHEPIELLFIDGAHEYELVREDFEKWVPKVVDGGVVAMHDTTWADGPKRVAGELVYRSRGFKDVRFVIGSTTIGRKVAGNSHRDRARARFQLLVKSIFAVVSTGLKTRRVLLPKPLENAGRRLFRSMR